MWIVVPLNREGFPETCLGVFETQEEAIFFVEDTMSKWEGIDKFRHYVVPIQLLDGRKFPTV